MGACVLGFDSFTSFDSSSEHVLHVHFVKLKKVHEYQSAYLFTYQFIQ